MPVVGILWHRLLVGALKSRGLTGRRPGRQRLLIGSLIGLLLDWWSLLRPGCLHNHRGTRGTSIHSSWDRVPTVPTICRSIFLQFLMKFLRFISLSKRSIDQRWHARSHLFEEWKRRNLDRSWELIGSFHTRLLSFALSGKPIFLSPPY